jgi:hypothetical protein
MNLIFPRIPVFVLIIIYCGPVLSEDASLPDVQQNNEQEQIETVEIIPDIPEAEAVLAKEFNISLRVRYPAGFRVYFPEKPAAGSFNLVDHKWVLPVQKDNIMEEKHTITLVPVRLGSQQIPGLDIPFISKQGEAGIVRSNPIKITVKGRLADEANPSLKPLPQPVAVFKKNEFLVWSVSIAGAVILTALITWGVFLYIRMRKERNRPPPPPRPAHVIAFEKLGEIANMRLIEQEKIKGYYILVSDVIREYFGNLFSINSLDATTTELLRILGEKDLKELTIPQIDDFLEECDFVKFAKYKPADREIESLMPRAHEIVTKSMRSGQVE